MLRFFLDRLSRSAILRPRRRVASRRVKRTLAWLGMICFTCISLNGMATLTQAQTPQSNQVAQTQPFVMPKLSAEPLLYYPDDSPNPVRPPTVSTATSTPVTTTGIRPVVAMTTETLPIEIAQAASTPTAATPTPKPTSEKSSGSTKPTQQYVMEFNRSPIVGNRLRLEGVYPATRLGFTRPKNWDVAGAKLRLRYQHSPSLLPDKSSLVVRLNDTSIGSVKLNSPNSQLTEAEFIIPPKLLQDYNEIALLAQHQTAETCSNPADPMLWTEVLPDSQIAFAYRPQPIQLDFSSYPAPFLDKLSLEPNQLHYLRPKTYSSDWLTATARFQTAAAREVGYRSLNTKLISDTAELLRDDRLIVIGTPAEQPILSQLSLPFSLKSGQFLDGEGQPVADQVGLLMLSTLKDQGTPVLVATGNTGAAVRQAVQFLVQPRDRQIGAGKAMPVEQVAAVASPDPRQWSGYLPTGNEFELKDLQSFNQEPFQSVTVRGTKAPSIDIPFHALPDDRFLRGSTMTVRYSHSPQVNPRTSAIEVKLDGVTIGSRRLDSTQGDSQLFRVNLPEQLIQPDSTLSVNFVMHPRELGVCGLETDQQLWGTLQSDTSFKLVRDMLVKLPNLKLLKAGFPFAAPQDLSNMAVLLPANPNDAEVETLLAWSERLGRISQADTVKYDVYLKTLPTEVRNQQHLVGIGTRAQFPIAEALQDQGFNIADAFARFWGGTKVHALPDQEGVIKQSNSPWNRERSLLALTAQTEKGLQEVQTLLKQDALFSQLRGDTVLISRNRPDPSPYDASGYNLEFLQDAPTQRIQHSNSFRQLILLLQDYWFFILIGMLLLALLLYSFSQLFLNRVAADDAS